jgi:hypothetical protein
MPPGDAGSQTIRRITATDSPVAIWTVDAPAGGVWTLTETNRSTGDLGVARGSVVLAEPGALPMLPPAGAVELTSCQGRFPVGKEASFTASVSGSSAPKVAGYTWFDDHGNEQTDEVSGPGGDTVQMSSLNGHFQGVLRTNGTDGQYRYTEFDRHC